MKKRVKTKKQKKTKVPVEKSRTDIRGLFAGIEERLDGMEKKIDSLVQGLQAGALRPQAEVQEKAPDILPAEIPEAPKETGGDKSKRPLHQTVCADCRKDCEVPFKPLEGRPVYCKACYGKRKKNHSRAGNGNVLPGPALQDQPKQVQVTPRGPGKLTVSVITSAPTGQPMPAQARHPRHFKRPKRSYMPVPK